MSLLTGAISGPADREAAFADPLDCLPTGPDAEAGIDRRAPRAR
jgi:hypothetical protein